MGGGAGISVHGRFRIATENSLFAMPETGLGLFPDIGASYFLSRLPGFFGNSSVLILPRVMFWNNRQHLSNNYVVSLVLICYLDQVAGRNYFVDFMNYISCSSNVNYLVSVFSLLYVSVAFLKNYYCTHTHTHIHFLAFSLLFYDLIASCYIPYCFYVEKSMCSNSIYLFCFLEIAPFLAGEYVGLTGARLDGAEMLACGLATHFVQSERLPLLEEALVKADSSDPVVISTTIGEFSHAPNLKNTACCRLDIINKCFSKRTVEEIIAALEREAADKKDDWISSTIQSLKKASPISLKVSLRSIREGRLQSIGKCLVLEFRIVCHIMLGEVSKDFIEGCRAILLDKDKNPKWAPSKLESISDEMVDRYFSKVDDDDWEDLKLSVSSELPASVMAKL